MARHYPFTALNPAHWPSLLLIVGYPVWWLELFIFHLPGGHTTFLAFGIVAALVLSGIRCGSWRITAGRLFENAVGGLPRWFWMPAGILCVVIGLVAFRASLLPPHLLQEFDAINYHITIPRQHLIPGSFSVISWSPADLFLAPVSHALAPYWLVTEWPNKVPQFFFLAGLVAVAGRLIARAAVGPSGKGLLAAALVLGMHVVGIQAGTAMLDTGIAYLFFAAIDSYLDRRWVLAGIEFCFFFWSKPLMPVSMALVLSVTVFFLLLTKRPCRPRPAFIGTFLLSGLLVAGPFVWKSWTVSGTPVYPVTSCVLGGKGCTDVTRLSPLEGAACSWAAVRDAYGHGRSVRAFLTHWWLIAVPEKGVNNSFDYPLGLMYLILAGPFFLFFFNRPVSACHWLFPLAVFCVVFWMGWWEGSQQSRFLLVPLIGMAVVVGATTVKPSPVFLGVVLMALALTCLSVLRAHGPDLGRSAESVLRSQDRDLLVQASKVVPGETLIMNRPDVAFSPVRVQVRGARSLFSVEE